jgi:hypothetical protein
MSLTLTDRPPRKKALRLKFTQSEALVTIPLPEDERLRQAALAIESALTAEARATVQRTSAEFIRVAADFYSVPVPKVSALAARPLRVREGAWASELFGDYALATGNIRVWTRTAVQKKVTSFGTFLSTLCHEFCHHLDCACLGFSPSPHTRGFYARTAVLYHHARGTPLKPIAWAKAGDRWRIDWGRMRRN